MSLSTPLQEQPVLPFFVWGLRFDEDLMVALEDPDWGMIEVGKVKTPTGDIWFSLDSRNDGRQFVGIANTPQSKHFVTAFPAPSYANQIIVNESETLSGTQFDVFYRRNDHTPIQFSLTAPDTNKTPRKRNGNGMNHSEDQTLALLDITSLHLSGRSLEWAHKSQPVFRIAGKPIVARMRQTVGGVHSGQWLQKNGLIRFGPIDLTFSTKKTELGMVMESSGYPRLSYHFIEQNGHMRLSEIQVAQPHVAHQDPIFQIKFETPLPDLRFGSPQQSFSTSAYFSINQQPAYSVANIELEPLGRSVQINIVPQAPYWAVERPISIVHHPSPRGIETHAWVLTQSQPKAHLFHLSEQDSFVPLNMVGQQKMLWEKNPHRVSTLALDPQRPEMGGGTWANGIRSTDQMQIELIKQAIPKDAEFYSVPTIGMVRNHDTTDLRLEANIRVRLPVFAESAEQITPFIHSFRLSPGPFHENSGMTLSGFSIGIENIEQDSEGVLVDINAMVPFGSVPDRKQDLKGYSAFLQINLGIGKNPGGEHVERQQFQEIRTLPAYRSFKRLYPDPLSPEIEYGLLQSWGFEILDDGLNKGRYLRGISISTAPSLDNDEIIMTAKWSRETTYRIHKKILVQSQNQDR